MKTQLITTLAVAAIGIVLAGCRTVGDGVAEQKTFAGMQVEAIEITGPWTVEMNCGARENSVTVTVEQNLWKYVSIRTGRKFRLALDKDVSFTLPLKLTVNSTGNLSIWKISVNSGGIIRQSASSTATWRAIRWRFSPVPFPI